MNIIFSKKRKNAKFIYFHSFNNGTKKSFASYLIRECQAIDLNVIFPKFPTGNNANYDNWQKIFLLMKYR